MKTAWIIVAAIAAAPTASLRATAMAASRTAPLWWADGHAIVCDIAWRDLGRRARDGVRELLAADPGYAELGPSCSWADVVRGRGRYPEYEAAHYVNIPRGVSGLDVARDCAATLCVVEAIEMFAGRLRDRSLPVADRLVALKFLGHFVGDVHQPLHAGYGDDRGGNGVPACIPGRDRTNLHAVWDGYIVGRRLRETGLDWKRYGERLHAEIRPADRRAWRSLDPVVWADESYALVESEVYEGSGRGCFTPAYAAAHAATVDRRLKQAGVRLGALLNDIFDAGP